MTTTNDEYLIITDQHKINLLRKSNDDFIRGLVGYRLQTKSDIELYKFKLNNQIDMIEFIENSLTYKNLNDGGSD